MNPVDRRVPKGNRCILTDEEIDYLLDKINEGYSANPIERTIAMKLRSFRPKPLAAESEDPA